MLRGDRRVVSFDHSDEHQEVSIGSVKKESKANKKKASKRDIIVVDDQELRARNGERIPKNTTKVNFWCLNVWNKWAAERNALPQNSADLGVCEGNITVIFT